jgi:hypothetical protein
LLTEGPICISCSSFCLDIFRFYGSCGRIFKLSPQTLTEAWRGMYATCNASIWVL